MSNYDPTQSSTNTSASNGYAVADGKAYSVGSNAKSVEVQESTNTIRITNSDGSVTTGKASDYAAKTDVTVKNSSTGKSTLIKSSTSSGVGTQSKTSLSTSGKTNTNLNSGTSGSNSISSIVSSTATNYLRSKGLLGANDTIVNATSKNGTTTFTTNTSSGSKTYSSDGTKTTITDNTTGKTTTKVNDTISNNQETLNKYGITVSQYNQLYDQWQKQTDRYTDYAKEWIARSGTKAEKEAVANAEARATESSFQTWLERTKGTQESWGINDDGTTWNAVGNTGVSQSWYNMYKDSLQYKTTSQGNINDGSTITLEDGTQLTKQYVQGYGQVYVDQNGNQYDVNYENTRAINAASNVYTYPGFSSGSAIAAETKTEDVKAVSETNDTDSSSSSGNIFTSIGNWFKKTFTPNETVAAERQEKLANTTLGTALADYGQADYNATKTAVGNLREYVEDPDAGLVSANTAVSIIPGVSTLVSVDKMTNNENLSTNDGVGMAFDALSFGTMGASGALAKVLGAGTAAVFGGSTAYNMTPLVGYIADGTITANDVPELLFGSAALKANNIESDDSEPQKKKVVANGATNSVENTKSAFTGADVSNRTPDTESPIDARLVNNMKGSLYNGGA